MPSTNTIAGLVQVLVPFIGQLLVSNHILPADTWTQIGTILVALAGAGWSASTTHVSTPPAPPAAK